MKTVVLAGGVGGGRFARAVVESVPPADVTVVGNVGDDLEVLGLHVSPDLDSVLYALAGLNDEDRGWGRADESWRTCAPDPPPPTVHTFTESVGSGEKFVDDAEAGADSGDGHSAADGTY